MLSETERILDEETTAQHRTQWPNVYRLESATKDAQKNLALADARITQVAAANEIVASAEQARDAIRAAVDSGGGDLIGSADRLLNATAQIKPGQRSPEEATAAAASAREQLAEIQRETESRKAALGVASRELEKAQERFETRESTLTKFLDDLTNVAAEFEFQKQAEGYERESRLFWIAGLFTLVVAACAAILPLILNYANPQHHGLHGQSSVSAHLGAALAFAAVAGVFLARARNRDRDRQRNRDLAVALITMFAYSEQIANEQEKERFKHDMGRLVIEAFLRQEPPSEDRSSSILSELTSRATPTSQPQES
ncbi:MAG TPA: hypothetical protein VH275_05330 [Solirubrobacterales bacterium]|jgi:hypothetical protein|nr:hypothetical protein [Solirubrobacterales bacterium]